MFKAKVFCAAYLALTAYAQKDPCDVDPDNCPDQLSDTKFIIENIVQGECTNPCDCDPDCTPSSASEYGDPCSLDPSCETNEQEDW